MGQGVFQVQVTALDPTPTNLQQELFTECDRSNPTDTVMDSINQRYGEFTLAPANLLGRSKMPNVISPAWKPFGHRETISGKFKKEAESN